MRLIHSNFLFNGVQPTKRSYFAFWCNGSGQRLPISLHQPRLIAIDPRISFGRPIVMGTRIPTVAIAERYETGETPESIADDLGYKLSQIHDAIRFELGLAQTA